MKTLAKLSIGSIAALMLALGACNSLNSQSDTTPTMKLAVAHDHILTSESTTLYVKSENTLGKHAKVTWDSSFGSIKPEKEGLLDFRSDKPAALFSSDKPGTAVVTATVKFDDGQVLTDSVNITVDNVK